MAKRWMMLKYYRSRGRASIGQNRRRNPYIQRFGICRICFRELAYNGKIPGLRLTHM